MLKSSPMYFQMDKNEKYILQTPEDYKNMGKRAYKSAEEYFAIFERCFYMILSENLNAICMNISFACELYLKSLLYYKNIDCGKMHDFLELYNLLPYEIKAELKTNHPCSNCNKDNFEQELKELGKAFIVFRYSYERKRLAWNMQFLIELVITLRDFANKIFNEEKKKGDNYD